MAIDSKKVLAIDTSESQLSIAQLKKQVSDYKKELDNCIVGSKEAADAADKLNKAQTALNAAQKGAIDTMGKLDDSYNGLSNQMRKLKDEQKKIDLATADGQKRFDEYAKKIFEINDKLKSLDEQNGVYSRNVGNYTKSMVDAFNSVGISIGNISPLFATLQDSMVKASSQGQGAMAGLAGGVKGLGTSLKALAANPVGAVIMAIVVAIKAAKVAIDAFKGSIEGNEVASNNLAKALAPIKGIVDTLKGAFDDFVEVVTAGMAWVGNAIGGVMEFLGISNDMIKAEIDIATLEQSNAEEHRRILTENAQLELDASEARQKAADKDKYTAQERLKFAQEYADKQKEIAANNLKEAQNELKLLEAQGATGKNNKEMNDKLAEAQAKVLNVQKAYNEVLRSTNKEIHNINQEIDKDAVDAQKKAQEAWKKHVEEVNKAKAAYKDVEDTLKEFTQNALQNDIDKVNKTWDELTKKAKENAKNAGKSGEELNNTLAQIEDARSKDLNDIYTKYGDLIKEANNAFYALYNSDAENKIAAEEKKLQAQRKAYKESLELQKQLGIVTAEEIADNLAEYDKYIEKSITKIKKDLAEADLKKEITELIAPEVDIKDVLKNNIIKALEDGDIDSSVARKAFEKLGFDANTINAILLDISNKTDWKLLTSGITNALTQMGDFAAEIATIGEGISSEWANVFNDLSVGFADVAKDIEDGKKGWQTYAKMATYAFSAAADAMMAMADEQDETTKEGFEQQKKYQISAAVMSMLSGIVGAWASSMQLMFPANVIVGSLLSAMMGTLGGIQIGKIAKTQFGGSDTGGDMPAVNIDSIQAISTPTTYTEDVNGAAIEENIKDSRVYVVESDIQATGRKVQVAQTESRF